MMKRRVFAALLASALALSLTACGGGSNNGNSSSNPGSASGSGAGSSQPDASNDVPTINESDLDISLTLNKTEVTLNKAGAAFQLNWTVNPPVEMTPTFTSSDEAVARVDDQGKITAVAPGTAVITVEQRNITIDVDSGKVLSATCTVTCDWKVSEPAPKPDTSKPSGGSSSSSGSGSSSAAKADLSGFYSTVTGKYQFAFMMEADADMLNNFFAGLSDLKPAQQAVYLCGMSPSPNGDFVLVQVSDSKDVDTVKSILQARIDYMVGDGNGPGGAFYPMEQTMWEENARVVANGSYVMLIVHENCDDIVNDFNALF